MKYLTPGRIHVHGSTAEYRERWDEAFGEPRKRESAASEAEAKPEECGHCFCRYEEALLLSGGRYCCKCGGKREGEEG